MASCLSPPLPSPRDYVPQPTPEAPFEDSISLEVIPGFHKYPLALVSVEMARSEKLHQVHELEGQSERACCEESFGIRKRLQSV